jgi:molybdopterin molybdotransferase
MIERLVGVVGGRIAPSIPRADLTSVLTTRELQFVVVVGGSGGGRDDRSVQTLARVGRVDVHGIAIGPGQTTALGSAGDTAVLILPGRIDAALTAWLTVGVPVMCQLTGSVEDRTVIPVTLERKVTSTVGLQELIPVRVREGKALPLASGYLPLHALSQANAYILVPAESEGLPEGAMVGARLMP